jgi:hypothetical protein
MNASNLTALELKAIQHMLKGSEVWKHQILNSLTSLVVVSREDTGAGGYTYFSSLIEPLKADIPFDMYQSPLECRASHPGLPGTTIFLLWLKGSQIDCLEIATGIPLSPEHAENGNSWTFE